MFGLADLDRNGVVDFEEFVVMQVHTLALALRLALTPTLTLTLTPT